MNIKQHIPTFVEGVEPKEGSFETEAELLAIPFVNSWSKDPGFFRYSIDDYVEGVKLLMAEFDEGYKWWVIGYIRGDTSTLSLPKFESKWKEENNGTKKQT